MHVIGRLSETVNDSTLTGTSTWRLFSVLVVIHYEAVAADYLGI